MQNSGEINRTILLSLEIKKGVQFPNLLPRGTYSDSRVIQAKTQSEEGGNCDC